MLEIINNKKTREKRTKIIKRLRELNYFPQTEDEMTEEQRKHYNQICNFDFSYWEEIKVKYRWTPKEKLTIEQRFLTQKRHRVRTYFRDNNILPKYGEPLNDEQQKIFDDIENNNFEYFELYLYRSDFT